MSTVTAKTLISYSSLDQAAARDAAMFLVADGVDVWFDEWELALGDSIPNAIDEALTQATHVVLLWSEHAAASSWVTAEREAAFVRAMSTGEPKIVPVLLDSEPLPPLLSSLHSGAWEKGSEDARRRLISAVLDRPPSDELVRAVVAKYNELIYDEDLFMAGDPFGITACPQCGARQLGGSTIEDSIHDRRYYTIACSECDWSSWTEG